MLAHYVCEFCGTDFTSDATRHDKNRTPRYCSRTCANRAHAKGLKPHTCLFCGKVYTTDKLTSRRYCSKECRRAAAAKRAEPNHFVVACAHCGKPFETTKGATLNGRGRHCSPACQYASRRRDRTPDATCEWCGEPFYRGARGNDKFCSMPCWRKSQRSQLLTRPCPHCGVVFHTYREGRVYCSKACKDSANRDTAAKTCQECGGLFHRGPDEIGQNWSHRKYCSKECRKAGKIRNSRKQIAFTCQQCRRVFSVQQSQRHRKYCSMDCRRGALAEQKARNYHPCKQCGKMFYSIPSRPALFCSKKCEDISHQITQNCAHCGKEFTRTMGYARSKPNRFCSKACYNAHAVWEFWRTYDVRYDYDKYPPGFNAALKEAVRERDAYVCQECGVSQDQLRYKLSVHHIDYNKVNLALSNLISLCHSCHGKTNLNRDFWSERYTDAILQRAPLDGALDPVKWNQRVLF